MQVILDHVGVVSEHTYSNILNIDRMSFNNLSRFDYLVVAL